MKTSHFLLAMTALMLGFVGPAHSNQATVLQQNGITSLNEFVFAAVRSGEISM